MLDFTIRAIVRMERAEKAVYIQPCHTLGLTVSGLAFCHASHYAVDNSTPFIWFGPQGSTIEFEYGSDRENFAILIESDHIRQSDNFGSIDIFNGEEWLSIPCISMLHRKTITGWRMHFMSMLEAFRHPTAANRLRVELGVLHTISYLIEQTSISEASNPAVRLKEQLDADTWDHSIEELSADIGLSSDHLRTLFKDAFGMSPKAYRERRRMGLANELIVNGNLSIKEIAYTLGFKQATHFSAAFSSFYGYPPKEGIRRLRQNTPPAVHGNITNKKHATPESEKQESYLLTVCPDLP